jgi:hypothetical protein
MVGVMDDRTTNIAAATASGRGGGGCELNIGVRDPRGKKMMYRLRKLQKKKRDHTKGSTIALPRGCVECVTEGRDTLGHRKCDGKVRPIKFRWAKWATAVCPLFTHSRLITHFSSLLFLVQQLAPVAIDFTVRSR